MNIMYIRVSTEEQNIGRQEEMISKFDIGKTFIDKASGKNVERPALKEMLLYVRKGDVLYVDSISRLARNVKDLLTIVEQLNKKEVEFVSIKENIDTSTAQGRFMLTVFSAMAELEHQTILMTQKAGIELAKKRGVYKGRAPMKYDKEKFRRMVREVKDKRRTATSVMKEFNITATTYYRWINKQ